MYLRQIIIGLTSLGALTAAAPSRNDVKGMRHEIREEAVPTSTQASSPNIPQNTTNFVGLDSQPASNQLLQFAEEDLLAQVKQQIALTAEIQAIKNNIRLNSLAAQFSQVNTVLVVVTNIIDARNPLLINRRYLVNSLFVDNGFPDKQQVVYATESQEITVSATSATTTSIQSSSSTTTTPEPTPTSVLSPADPSNIDLNLTSPPTFLPPTNNLPPHLLGTTPAILTTTITTILPLTSLHLGTPPFLDPTTAFLLPFAALAPTSPMALILPSDPANLIYAHQNQIDLGAAACLGVLGGAGNAAHLYGSAQQALAAQLAGLLQIGGGGAHVVVDGEEEGKKKAEEVKKNEKEEKKNEKEEKKKAEEVKKNEKEEKKKAEEARKKEEEVEKKKEKEEKKKVEEAKKVEETKKKAEEGKKNDMVHKA